MGMVQVSCRAVNMGMVQVSWMLQGPPSTGNTRNILGLLSVALHAQAAVQRAGVSNYAQTPLPAEQ